MIENVFLAIFEAIALYALHSQLKAFHGTKKRQKLKAKLRGCL